MWRNSPEPCEAPPTLVVKSWLRPILTLIWLFSVCRQVAFFSARFSFDRAEGARPELPVIVMAPL